MSELIIEKAVACEEANETGIPYQTLINLYLVDCVKSKKKLELARR